MSKVKVPNSVLKFNSLENDLSTTVASALWKKVAEIEAYLQASIPVGTLIWFRHTQDFLPEMPDPRYWQEMDGSTVVNPNSPFNGMVLPNLRGCFLKHPVNDAANHKFGSSDTRNFTHSHGGFTGDSFPAGSYSADDSDEIAGVDVHRHAIVSALNNNVDIRPPYRGFRFFLRIV